MKKTLLAALSLVILIGLVVLLTSGAGSGLTTNNELPLIFSGTVETREIRLGSKAGGRVLAVLVTEGQQARAGQSLVRLDIAELEAQRQQAEANLAQQQARLLQLEHGARPEEIAQAHAAAAAAHAALEAVRNGARPEEIAQARAELAAVEAEAAQAEGASLRYAQLFESGDVSRQDFELHHFRAKNLRARRTAVEQHLELLLNGNRAEDVRVAEERYQQALAAEKLLLAGTRSEELAAARAQLAVAQARLEQLRVQLAEGEIRAPGPAMVESISVRPGDLITPNQPVAKLLELDQVWVRIYVPEPQLGSCRVGQAVRIRVDTFTDREFAGVIEQINSQGEFTPRNVQSRDERNHLVFGVKVRLANHDGIIKSGMATEVTLEAK